MVDATLRGVFDDRGPAFAALDWFQAMEYSLFSGGKRLRPVLAIAAAESLGGRTDVVLPVAAAIEMVHTYSLIHDDLPVLDNDSLRRGRPTCHILYGVDTAVRAGLGLQWLACSVFSDMIAAWPDYADRLRALGRDVFHAAGFDGMVGGQVADMMAEQRRVGLEEVAYIHRNKTAAMIRVSVLAGCNLSCDDPLISEHFAGYGEKIGLAFQIIDDILDIAGDTDVLGKNARSDVERGKATWPSHVGLEQARDDARRLIDEAIDHLDHVQRVSNVLVDIAWYLYNRNM